MQNEEPSRREDATKKRSPDTPNKRKDVFEEKNGIQDVFTDSFQTSFLESSFCIEEKESQLSTSEDFPDSSLSKDMFHKALLDITSDLGVLGTHAKPLKVKQFLTPPRKARPVLKTYSSPQLIDPDESVDLETCTLRRRRKLPAFSSGEHASERDLSEELISSQLKAFPTPHLENGHGEDAGREEDGPARPSGNMKSTQSSQSSQAQFPYFSGFKTASGKEVSCSESSFARARKSLDFLDTQQEDSPSTPRSTPKSQSNLKKKTNPFAGRPEVEHMVHVYTLVKQKLFPITRTQEEEHCIFSLFKWTWIALLPQIQEMRARRDKDPSPHGDGLGLDVDVDGRLKAGIEELVVQAAERRWKENHPSVLKRIVEKDEVPGVYMKLLVLREESPSIWVSDGHYSVRASLDPFLQKDAHRLSPGTLVQVVGAELLLPSATPIDRVYSKDLPALLLKYNGTKPARTGPLGYQKECAFVRALSSVRPQGGLVGCAVLTLTKLIKSQYLVNLNGSKSIIEEDRIEDTMGRISKSIKDMNLDRSSERKMLGSVRAIKFDQYEVSTEYTLEKTSVNLTVWNPPADLSLLKKTFFFFFLKSSPYQTSSSTLFLTTTSFTIIKRAPDSSNM
ncbi:hypothetical protein NECID01_0712 [Nematocida sp. AWRm77]|nr:hypothetical protein NECID01_0712 [Nematocida sp. AWRm77]